jgi:Domain of unknown function (DUF1906)
MYLGLDRSGYPGDAVMASLWASTPLRFVGVYLAPAPSHSDTAWMSKVPWLRAMGWGFLPTYVGQQAAEGPGSHVLTADRGRQDAQGAAALAEAASFPSGSVIYLDLERGGYLTRSYVEYVAAWADEVDLHTDYWAGVYCSYKDTAAQLADRLGDVPTWVYRVRDGGPSVVDLATERPPAPVDSGFEAAVAWQYRMSLTGSVEITWVGSGRRPHRLGSVDLNSSTMPDPSIRAVDAGDREASMWDRRKRLAVADMEAVSG